MNELHRHLPIVQQLDNYDGYLANYGVFRAIKVPVFRALGIFSQIRYSEYVIALSLPFILLFNVLFGPWKVFRQSVLWLTGFGTFNDIWVVWWSKFSIFWINIYLQITVPLWLIVQIFGVPIEIIWFFMQLGWWMLSNSFNVFRYNVMIWWEFIGFLFAGSLYVNYKYADFIAYMNTFTGSSFWWVVFGISNAIVFFPVVMFVWWNYMFWAGQIGWCYPDYFCYPFTMPTGAIS